ncbi:MAG: YicC family protein [Prevotella sp.]|nr:YicC family protein [Prevotella sp.]
MIQSMTGYGKTTVAYNGKKINVEVKSLNSKQLDMTSRIAPLYREKELEMRQILSEKLLRGKVEFNVWVENDETAEGGLVNTELMQSYYNQLKAFADKNQLKDVDWMVTLVRMPDVFNKVDTEEVSDEEWAVVRQAVCDAVQNLIDFRTQEGAALAKKFSEKIDNIEQLLASIEPYEKSRVEKIRARITEGLKQIPDAEYDKNRLEQELIYYIEKLDISEEKQRLTNHLQYFRQTMADAPGQGKKLGFIAQEMGREINTTGSKSNQAEMQNIVVKMKDELEQIKEQVLNVL